MSEVMTKEQVDQEMLQLVGHDLDFVREKTKSSIIAGEVEVLFRTADAIAPKVTVEIGSRFGTSTTILGSVAKKHSGLVYCFDKKPLPLWVENMEFFGLTEHVLMFKGTSPWIDWGGKPFQTIDYLLIDADHSFRATLVDYHCWSQWLRIGGRVAFHDTFNFQGVTEAIVEIEKGNELKLVEATVTKKGLSVFEKIGPYRGEG